MNDVEKQIADGVEARFRAVSEAVLSSAKHAGIPVEYHALVKLIAWEAIAIYLANPVTVSEGKQ